MPVWTFCCLDGKSDKDNLWHDWWSKDADGRAQGVHETRFKYLETRALKDWPPKWFKQLGQGLIEIKIPSAHEWRLLGFTRNDHEFVFVSVCYHKERRYYPNQDAIERARAQMKIAQEQPARVRKSVRPSKAS